ncbi:MAG: TlpA disulfide reductase family protein [Bacteroidia bacterium]
MFKTTLFSILFVFSLQSQASTVFTNLEFNADKKPAKASKISYQIKGTLDTFKNHLIVLSQFRASKELILIDSVRTNSKGEFTLKGNYPTNFIAYVQYTQNIAIPLIIENGCDIKVTINPNTNGLNYELGGTKVHKSQNMYDFIKSVTRLSSELGALEQQIANEADAKKMQMYQFMFASKQQELRMSMDTMLLYESPLESYFVLFNFTSEYEIPVVKSIMQRLEANEKASPYYADLKTIYDNNKLLAEGEVAPDIVLNQPNGKVLKLSDLKGKVVLIDFWASWCGPCRAEFPNVKRVYSKYKDQGFEIFGVSLDKDSAAWVNSINALGLNWRHVSDLKYWSSAPAKLYKVTGIPFTVLLDKEGRIIAKNLRGEELERKLEELFP